ncbi:FtsX-like permease family protein [Paenibacillus doosanensis]|uniref:ABC transporter permease n=1 Tax=Paenibacillus doosanensis TaxID=1229154 RepID=UPI0021806F8B|nr:FtsX-like permease family protein [Paenibacillus doosanensis]MCS7464700.1 FtsX-like permease family protein [Paenibacillus doosanensis]
MSLPHLLWRNMMHRKTLSLLTVCSVALTVALLVFLILCSQGVEQGAEKGYGPFELTVGAQGSSTQLALNTYYHVGTPTGNIPYEVFAQLEKEEQAEAVYAMTTGDNYNGYPIVGVDAKYFLTRYGDKKLEAGTVYLRTGEAVVGSHIARTLGVKVGDTFRGGHGLLHEGEPAEEEEAGESHEEHEAHAGFLYTVVGILPPLHTPDDRAVFTTVDYAWAVHHSQQGEHKDVTSVLVKPRSLLGAQTLKTKYDKLGNVQAIYTSKAVADVVNVVDKGSQVIRIVTMLCIVLAAISILLSLTSAVNERKKDVGLLRLIGKSRTFVWLSLIGEGLLLTLIGLLLGLAAGHAGSYAGRDALFDFSGIALDVWRLPGEEWLLMLGTLVIGALASLWPAMKIYRVDPLQLFRS